MFLHSNLAEQKKKKENDRVSPLSPNFPRKQTRKKIEGEVLAPVVEYRHERFFFFEAQTRIPLESTKAFSNIKNESLTFR